MKVKLLSLCFCLLAFCVFILCGKGTVVTTESFHPGVQVLASGTPVDVETGHSVPAVGDWNNDGKKDLITGQFSGGKIRLYLNNGTDAEPVFNDFKYMKAGGKEISLPAG
ncbi:FG-GAP repeat domain-containing protein [candidate division KSB1 bacterium]